MPKRYTRKDIGLQPAKKRTLFKSTPIGFAFHWAGGDVPDGTDLGAVFRLMRAYQRQHQAPGGLGAKNGADDIAYSVAFTQQGDELELRGDEVQSGANGTTEANRTLIAILCLVDIGEEMSEAMKTAIKAYIARKQAQGVGRVYKGHKHIKATACPGDAVMRFVIELNGGTPLIVKPEPSSAATFPLPKGHWYGKESKNPKNHSGYWPKDRAPIALAQRRLGIKDDGIYGNQTAQAVYNFQRKVFKDKKQWDSLLGANTWAKLFA